MIQQISFKVWIYLIYILHLHKSKPINTLFKVYLLTYLHTYICTYKAPYNGWLYWSCLHPYSHWETATLGNGKGYIREIH